MNAISHASLRIAGLHQGERCKQGAHEGVTAAVPVEAELSAAPSAAAWTKHREEEFLRLLSHKLRNPLAPIATCVQILQSRAPQDRLLHHALDLMDRQLTRLAQLLDDLSVGHLSASCEPIAEVQPVCPEVDTTVMLRAAFNTKQRVLIVDDNLDAAEALRLLLCIKGFEVFTASSGVEAIKRTVECAPDLILMDLDMPAMSGWEAARRIHAMPECQAIAIVALTGLDHDCDRERSRQSGMVQHLVKPVEVAAVQEVLRNLIPEASAYRS